MWRQYVFLALTLASILGCIVGLPAPDAPEAPKSEIKSVDIPATGDDHPHDVQRRAVRSCELCRFGGGGGGGANHFSCIAAAIRTFSYADACLTTLYVVAFTSDVHEGSTSAAEHSIELHASGQVRSLRLYNRPGVDTLAHKGDLWEYPISRFHFTDNCIRIGEIRSVSIIESGSNGWNIESIVTLVRDSYGGVGLLTQDFHVNRWIDSNRHFTHRRFQLTRA